MTNSPIVNEISHMDITGNVVPVEWFKHITFKNGKPDLLGIMILSEIIYWYRATAVREESTGQIKSYKKKFAADMLQRSYQSFADQFGVSKKQAQEAVYRLRDKGIIVVDVRNIITKTKQVLSNVTYFAPVPEAIKRITYPSPVEKGGVSLLKGTPIPLERDTYTETTTKTTTQSTLDKGVPPTVENTAFSFTEYISHYSFDEYKYEAIVYYLLCYKEQFRKHHPKLKKEQWERVFDQILFCDELGEDLEVEQIKAMIDQHFQTQYKNCDFNILHFLTDGVKKCRFYEKVYNKDLD